MIPCHITFLEFITSVISFIWNHLNTGKTIEDHRSEYINLLRVRQKRAWSFMGFDPWTESGLLKDMPHKKYAFCINIYLFTFKRSESKRQGEMKCGQSEIRIIRLRVGRRKKKKAHTRSAIFWVYSKCKIHWNKIKNKNTFAIATGTAISFIYSFSIDLCFSVFKKCKITFSVKL